MTAPQQPEREMSDEQWAKEYSEGASQNKEYTYIEYHAYLAGLAKGRELEREACAKLADKERKKWGGHGGASRMSQQMHEYAKQACKAIAAAIRGRNE